MLHTEALAEGTLTTWAGMTRVQTSHAGVCATWLPAWTDSTQPGESAGATFDIERGDGAARDHLEQALRELAEYFAGERCCFTVTLAPYGAAFQRRAWHAVGEVSYGETRSYGEIARSIGAPLAVRAVGAANGANPIAPFIPCHRIVGSDGRLTGYGPGLPLKWRLLAMEDAIPASEDDYPHWVERVSERTGSPEWVLGVRATRAYCRPDTPHPARLRLVPNRIFATGEAAEAAGFAACAACYATGRLL